MTLTVVDVSQLKYSSPSRILFGVDDAIRKLSYAEAGGPQVGLGEISPIKNGKRASGDESAARG